MDLNFCTDSEFKVMQVRNFNELYIETKVKPSKADSLPETLYKASVTAQSYSDALYQSVNSKPNLILNRHHKSLKSSIKSSSSSSSKLESIPH